MSQYSNRPTIKISDIYILQKKFYPIKNIVFRITQRECADIVSILGGKSNFETNLQNIPTDKIRNEYCYS